MTDRLTEAFKGRTFVVEFVGPTGAGKSTHAASTRKRIRQTGMPLQTWTTGRERLGGDRGTLERLGRLKDLVPTMLQYPRSALHFAREAASARDPARTGLEVLDHWARSIVKMRRSREHPGIRVFDEGAFHTLYLLAFRMESPDSGLVDRLVDAFPALPDLVVIGEASAAAIRRRLATTSEPSALRAKLLTDPAEAERAVSVVAQLRDSILRLSERSPIEVLLLDMERDEALSFNVERILATIERVSRTPPVRS